MEPLRRLLRNLIDGGIDTGDPRTADPAYVRRVRTVNGCLVTMLVATVPTFLLYVAVGAWELAMALPLPTAVSLLTLLDIRRGGSVTRGAHVNVILFMLILLFLQVHTGGIFALGLGWVFVPPMYAGLVLGLRVAGLYTALALAQTVAFTGLSIAGVEFHNMLPAASLAPYAGAVRLLLGMVMFALVWAFLSAQKQAEDALRAAHAEAERANRAKSAFLATMSHEIRTPMNAVIGMTGLLHDTPLNDEQDEFVETIRTSGDALLCIINDILDFSKIESGNIDLEAQPFDVRSCVEDALDLLAPGAAEKRIDLAYLCQEDVPRAVVGDLTRLRQILVNLVSNAVKFTERGEVVVHVSAERRETGDIEIAFAVRDSGIGIPPDRIDRLFRSFSQVDSSTTRKYGGTGLGLAISKRLAELMGGTIVVKSSVGVGSIFRVTIIVPEATDWERRPQDGAMLAGKRVLIVDDNAANVGILRRQVGAWGMETRTTCSPAQALEWVRAGEPFDLAVLDLVMPGMDGMELATAIRQVRTGTLPMVLLTSVSRSELQSMAPAGAASSPFAAIITKPAKPSQLLDSMMQVLVGTVPSPVERRSDMTIDHTLGTVHPLRILLAEDNLVNQKVAVKILERLGYRADVVGNGLEVLAGLERQDYDVVLMDMQMPELDGLETTRAICERWPSTRPRIVAMTANAMQDDRDACLAAGMDDFLSKPVAIRYLAAALERTPARTRRGAAAKSADVVA